MGARSVRGATARLLLVCWEDARRERDRLCGAFAWCMCGRVAFCFWADSNGPWVATGVTERTAAEGRARASKTRRTPASMSAGRRPLRVAGVSKAMTEEVTAIVPHVARRRDEQERQGRCCARGNRFG